MTQERPYVRRHFFVKKEYQTKFILKFCLLVLAGCLLSMTILFFLSNGTLTSTFENSRLLVRKTGFAILPSVILTNLITLVIIGLATIMVVLFISHKIAGPIFRFEKELKLIGQGDLTIKIRLRKNDQLKDLSESLNHYQSISDLERLDSCIRFSPEDMALKNLFSFLRSVDPAVSIQKKVDAIFERVREILDMRRRINKVRIHVYPNKEALSRIYARITGKTLHMRAWYLYETHNLS